MDLGQTTLRIGSFWDGIMLSERNQLLFVPPSVELKPKRKPSPFPLTSFESVYEYGQIKDTEGLASYLSTVLSAVGKPLIPLLPHKVLIAVPATAAQAHKEMLQETLRSAGFSSITFCSVPLAAIVGAGYSLPLKQPAVVAQMGASVSEIAMVQLSECQLAQPLLWTGEAFVSRLYERVSSSVDHSIPRSKIAAVVTQSWGEAIGALPREKALSGNQEILSQVPVEIFREYHEEVVEQISIQLELFLQDLTASQLSAIADQGILLSGGFANLYGLAGHAATYLKLPVFALPTSDLLVMHGLLKIQELLK
ncbi:rod shape-determining protein [Candidatus Woesebacteria bacterium]|nr:rod shape-determining protein [Candidatus Woesebacteria bacterium]